VVRGSQGDDWSRSSPTTVRPANRVIMVAQSHTKASSGSSRAPTRLLQFLHCCLDSSRSNDTAEIPLFVDACTCGPGRRQFTPAFNNRATPPRHWPAFETRFFIVKSLPRRLSYVSV